jgi:hypothetical protein
MMLLMASMCMPILDVSAQCNQNFVYGLTNVGMIRRINVTSGTVAAAINPAYGGNAPSYSNAMGYNRLNGKYYFFKRNSFVSPQEFVSFDPATNLYAMLAPSPVGAGNIINLGCVNNSGSGYYCLDALGILYYYNIASNTWTTICSNIRDQFNTTLLSVIDPMGLQRYYGDIAIDGLGDMWLLISGAVDYGLYKIRGPLPTSPVANLRAARIVPPTTLSPGGSFGGIAFNAAGDMYLSSNSPDNKLYRLTTPGSLAFVTNLGVDGIGNDLTSCSFPLIVLASGSVKITADQTNEGTVLLRCNMGGSANGTRYNIEHSTDGTSWDQIHDTLITSNDADTRFTFIQSNLVGGIHYYRIRKTETNQTVTYSAVEKVTVDSHTTIKIWPNPAQNVLKVHDVRGGSGTSWILIHGPGGILINRSLLKTGVNSFNIQSLPTGTYFVRVIHSNGEIMNQKLVKQ